MTKRLWHSIVAVGCLLAGLTIVWAQTTGGEQDALVKFTWQQLTMNAVRKLNGCDGEGKPWDRQCTIYPSEAGTPFVTFIHPGGHQFPKEAPALIAKFFKEQSR